MNQDINLHLNEKEKLTLLKLAETIDRFDEGSDSYIKLDNDVPIFYLKEVQSDIVSAIAASNSEVLSNTNDTLNTIMLRVEQKHKSIYEEGRLVALKMAHDELMTLRDWIYDTVPIAENKNPIKKSEIEDLLEQLEGFTWINDSKPGNKSPIPVSKKQFDYLVTGLHHLAEVQDHPAWSRKTVSFIKGVKAIMIELKPIIAPFINAGIRIWNKVLESLKVQAEDLNDID